MAEQPIGDYRHRPVSEAGDASGRNWSGRVNESLGGPGPALPGDWVVSGRREVEEVLRRSDIYSSSVGRRLGNPRPLCPLELDPPAHAGMRAALEPLFAPLVINDLAKTIDHLAADLIDDFAREPEIDFVARFSVPFPAQVLMALLGLPLRDLPRFLEFKDGVLRPDHVLGKSPDDAEVVAYRARTCAAAYDYFDQALAERHDEPTDDLLSRLLDARIDGEPMRREDVLDVCFTLLVEGVDPVSAALDCAFAFLAEHPEQRGQFVASRSTTNPRRAVEELLRWETPVAVVTRTATVDTELDGCPIGAGERVLALISAANVDRGEWPDADVQRWNREVNRHLSFGAGVHRCLGSHLARLQLTSALRAWHDRIQYYAVKPGAVLDFAVGVRTVDRFPMVLRRRA